MKIETPVATMGIRGTSRTSKFRKMVQPNCSTLIERKESGREKAWAPALSNPNKNPIKVNLNICRGANAAARRKQFWVQSRHIRACNVRLLKRPRVPEIQKSGKTLYGIFCKGGVINGVAPILILCWRGTGAAQNPKARITFSRNLSLCNGSDRASPEPQIMVARRSSIRWLPRTAAAMAYNNRGDAYTEKGTTTALFRISINRSSSSN